MGQSSKLIVPFDKDNDLMRVVYVQAVIMPNGELINDGNSLGFITPNDVASFGQFRMKYIFEEPSAL